ncbi:MAG: UDP-glucose/GDP-mannose dehydrogenase family protein [Saprospiraceae bacterium]|nr:UDP-glucose/GDP-mannose dehydrogenase family protein [Saprospiraceae bacterium]MBK8485475.1 UDP-glucose/GDP-mannose dehydrogenase family protein [Saprospiraceae bacterium]MBK9222702.1 UDP-glucose/GDP-mannose dehydrogenase family protein [Saprospiraceae bacterium]MBK9720253.1 UDP-glucose/GDP-mannose dehydrogenase family protein [Saprospiraceae bacterium]MBK9727248.1 UDP-glucose/GDP-mannose dehydrogenase family protein [Saprospiraceae bacterium]
MKITIVGTGYVGLVTGTCFAETGNHVLCLDINEKKIEALQTGNIPIFEPGLDIIFDRNTKEGRLFFTTDLDEAIQHGEIIFLALPTPPGEDGAADLSYVLNATQQISQRLKKYTILVNKSTVPIGTAEKVAEILSKNLDQSLFDVVSNPEFLREGVAVDDFMKPDRVVIGSNSEKARDKMTELYEPFVRQGNPIYHMDLRSAELTKYAANAYLATRISFMNEIANLCDLTGANVDMVRIGMGSDSRIGKRFLFPGVGYGGSCFPKDVNALFHAAEQNNYNFQILNSVMQVNTSQKKILSQKIKSYFKNVLAGKKIAIWGLAFKPNTDDIREAPALEIIQDLLDAGAVISAYDPEASKHVKQIFGDRIHFAKDMYEAIQDADALALITEWNVFRSPDFNRMKLLMKNKLIFDGRNVFEHHKMKEIGFDYISIGRH